MPNAVVVAGTERDRAAAINEIDALRRLGKLKEARRSAEQALAERSYDPELLDALARVLVDAGELQLACDAWDAARTIAPNHLGALKGLGFLAFRRGDLVAAERWLDGALTQSPSDRGVRGALQRLRDQRRQGTEAPPLTRETAVPTEMHAHRPSPAEPVIAAPVPRVTRDTTGSDPFLLLCDTEGLVLTGELSGADGSKSRAQVACDVGALAALLGRACAHLGLGRWESCVLDGDDAAYAVGSVDERTLVLSVARGEGAVGRVLVRLQQDRQRAKTRQGGDA